MYGKGVFMRGLYELRTGAKKTIASEIFGSHSSDRYRAFDYFIGACTLYMQQFPSFGLVSLRLHGTIEHGYRREAGSRFDERFGLLWIPTACARIDLEWPSRRWTRSAEVAKRRQRAFYNGWKSIHGLKHQTVNNAPWMIFGAINRTIIKYLVSSAYRGGNHSHSASNGTDEVFNGQMKSAFLSNGTT